MKNVIPALFCLLITAWLLIWGSFTADAQQKDSLLVIINGEISDSRNLDEISEQIDLIHFLSAKKAVQLYGAAGVGGALLVKTEKEEREEPLVLKDGHIIPVDSLQETNFRKIDVVRGRQALNIYGPAAKDGLWLVQTIEDPALLNVLIEVKNPKGKALKGIRIKEEGGKLLGITNHCGIAILENFSIGNSVVFADRKNSTFKIKIKEQITSIVLEK